MWITKIRLINVRGFEKADIEFSKKLNILIGPNNCGKSTILHSILSLQKNSLSNGDIKLRKNESSVDIFFDEFSQSFIKFNEKRFQFYRYNLRDNSRQIIDMNSNTNSMQNPIPSTEPLNFIYPYLSKRKVALYNETVNRTLSLSVTGDFSNLYPKIDRISNPEFLPAYSEYVKACDEILGFRISCTQSDQGKKACQIIRNFEFIPLDKMGEGVPNLLSLIADLCVSENQLFLIEEPENDIHPKALKKLLELIIKKSSTNQFIITTHSNIVVKYLGAIENSKIINLSMSFDDDKIPKSEINYINTEEERRRALEDLGYELYDSDLWSGWLFLEEASAEKIIRDYLIPLFIPELKFKLKTFSARTKDEVEIKFRDLNNLFVFLHLQNPYKNKAWVIIDSGDNEKEIIDHLKTTYTKSGWEENRFRQFSQHDFELYYPYEFQTEVSEILKVTKKKEKAEMKKALLIRLVDWCDKNPDAARESFSKSAVEVIEILKEIHYSLNNNAK